MSQGMTCCQLSYLQFGKWGGIYSKYPFRIEDALSLVYLRIKSLSMHPIRRHLAFFFCAETNDQTAFSNDDPGPGGFFFFFFSRHQEFK